MHNGEFLSILLAETGERTEIFRRVFDTDIFNRITVNLNNKQKEAKDKLQELKVAFATISSNVNLEEKVDSKEINELYINQILEVLKNELIKNKEEFRASEKEVKEFEKSYKQFEDELKEKFNVKIEVDSIKKSIDLLDIKIKEFVSEESKSLKYTESLKVIKENLKGYHELIENNNRLKSKIQRVKEIIILQNEHEKNVNDYTLQEAEFKASNYDYLEKEDEFFREQAGILALKLEENKPCPVCGSLEHPHPAVKSTSVLTKEELDSLKKKLALKQKNLNHVKEKITELNSKIKTLTEELEMSEDAEKEYKKLEEDLKENTLKLQEIYNIINNAYREISGKAINLQSFSFEKYEEEVTSKILKMKEEITKTKTLKEEKQKEFDTKSKLIENIDFDSFEVKLKANKKSLDEKRSMNVRLKMALENNKTALERLEKISKKLIDIMKEYNILDELYRTASGNLPGKPKINFEQYIQTNYFDMVVQEANKRFMRMTDARFQLLRKESSNRISDKIALELEVLDYYNGKKRDVKSLSGGEAFKAALCLALGLSDIIQCYSGGVQVDTLFIDEGFGSLDSESREQAINTLNQLADGNKLIGIISHVSELQERIDKKIIIEKGTDGSKIKIEH